MGLALRLLGLLVLLALLAFFTACEFALIRLRATRVEELAELGNQQAKAVERLQRRLRRTLLATQLGLCLSLLALGWGSHNLVVLLSGNTATPWLELLVFLGLTLGSSLLGGLLPKAWVLADPEAAALRLGPVLEAMNQALDPLLNLIGRLTDALLGPDQQAKRWARASVTLDALAPMGAATIKREQLPRQPLYPWLGFILILLWGLERWLSERSADGPG